LLAQAGVVANGATYPPVVNNTVSGVDALSGIRGNRLSPEART